MSSLVPEPNAIFSFGSQSRQQNDEEKLKKGKNSAPFSRHRIGISTPSRSTRRGRGAALDGGFAPLHFRL
jgi:hypothetical protein